MNPSFLFPQLPPMKRLALVIGLLLAIPLVGCRDDVEGRLPTFKVKGTVKYKGAPLEAADVILQFQELKIASFARTNAAGEFELATYDRADGAPAGGANITVTKWEQLPPSDAKIPGDPGYDPAMAYMPEKQPALLVPAKYTDFNTSGLKVVVNASSANPPLNIELQD
jgi:hypothetical protein